MTKKVLVTEDDQFLLSAYQAKLEKIDVVLRTASDGEEALQVLEDFSPDLIILDLIMPRKDGYEVLSTLKNDPRVSGVPILVTSNLSQPEDKEKALKLGAKEYIVKSDTSIADIVEKIKQYLQI